MLFKFMDDRGMCLCMGVCVCVCDFACGCVYVCVCDCVCMCDCRFMRLSVFKFNSYIKQTNNFDNCSWSANKQLIFTENK